MSEFSLVERAPQPTAVIRASLSVSDIPAFLGRAYQTAMQVLASQGMTPVREPFAY